MSLVTTASTHLTPPSGTLAAPPSTTSPLRPPAKLTPRLPIPVLRSTPAKVGAVGLEDDAGAVVQLARRQLLSCVVGVVGIVGAEGAEAAGELKCRGMRAYEMKLCLREARKQAEEEGGESRDDAFLKNRQYQQPGELVVTKEGVQYREIDGGNPNGRLCTPGRVCEIHYTVYRLASGAYYKYSSGGTPVFLWSVGYGNEGKDDVGSVYRFTLGEAGSLPRTVAVAMAGMREGGRRRVLVPPALGWAANAEMGPKPDTFGAYRRLEAHKDEALLFEAELVRVVYQDGEAEAQPTDAAPLELRPYQLPAPPTMDAVTTKGKGVSN